VTLAANDLRSRLDRIRGDPGRPEEPPDDAYYPPDGIDLENAGDFEGMYVIEPPPANVGDDRRLADPTTPEAKLAARVAEVTAKFPLLTWSQFRDAAPDEINWLVEGILAESQQSFIGAPAKFGKTWVGADLAVSVATGTPFLDRFAVPAAAPVIYLCLEGQDAALKTRFGCIARAHGVDPDSGALDNLHVRSRTPGINLADPAWADWITELVRTIGAKLLVVDVLRKAAPKLRESGEGANDFVELISNLAPIAELGCAVEFLHHFLKRSEGTKDRSVLEMLVGSGALGGHADGALGISKREKEGQLIRRLSVECDGRDDATPEPFTIELLGEATGKHGGWCYADTLTLRAVQDEPKKPRVDKRELLAIEIVSWISGQPNRTAKPAEIRDRFDLSEDELRTLRAKYLAPYIEVTGTGPGVRYTVITPIPGMPGMAGIPE
jgi:hypothetical protein